MHLLGDRYPGQVDILHYRPDDGQATGFRRESVNLISPLPNVAKEAFNGIGTSDVPMHHRRKSIKG